MPAHAVVALDTTAPSVSASLSPSGLLALSSPDEDIHEVRVWGEIDPTDPANADFGETEAEATWISFEEAIQVALAPDGKRVYLRARDDVHNETGIVITTIATASTDLILDTTPPSLQASIAGGAPSTATTLVSLVVDAEDAMGGPVEVRVWGSIDPTDPINASYGETEAEAPWIALDSPYQVRLLPGEGKRTLTVQARDEVHNTTTLTRSITLGEPAVPPAVRPVSRTPPRHLRGEIIRATSRLTVSANSAQVSQRTTYTRLRAATWAYRQGVVDLRSSLAVSSTGRSAGHRKLLSVLVVRSSEAEVARWADDGPDEPAALIVLDLL